MEIMDKHQNRADDLAENAPKFIRPIGPKVWDIFEKKASSCVRSPCILPSAQQTTYSSAEWHWQRAATTERWGAARMAARGGRADSHWNNGQLASQIAFYWKI